MGNSSGENNIIAIIGIILTAISIIVGVLLVKEGREYISRKFRIIVNTVKNLWAQFFIQALTLFIVGLGLLTIFIRLEFITLTLALPLATLLLIVFLMLYSLNSNIQKSLEKTDAEISKLLSTVNRITETEKAELKFVKEKWEDFLEQLSTEISLTAIHNVLVLSEPFAVRNQNIIITLPDILEPSIRNLSDRLKDVYPILNKVYEKPYKIVVHTSTSTIK